MNNGRGRVLRTLDLIFKHPVVAGVVAIIIATGVVGLVQAAHAGPGSPSPSSGKPTVQPTGTRTPIPFVGPVYIADKPENLQSSGDKYKVRGLVTIGSQKYQHGLQYELSITPATAEAGLSFTVPPGAHKFLVDIGLDSIQQDPNSDYSGFAFTYEVFVDGVRVEARQVQGKAEAQKIDVDVAGKSTMKLVLSAQSIISTAVRADWGDPQFN